MKFKKNLKIFDQLKEVHLGGLDAQFKLAPKMRFDYDPKKVTSNNPKKAAVLVLLYPNKNDNVTLLLTKRASYNGTHSAQISFPGGKFEDSDKNLTQTALRESQEEVGLIKQNIKILRKITDVYIPPSNFLVTPFIGITEIIPTFKRNDEVAEIIEISLLELLDDKNIGTVQINNSYMNNISVPCFKFNNFNVWGATGMILSEIKEALKKVQQ
tara:strand:+ start:23464 stop:24102 length:639 start_codon:yes stop_codon:yes gene_type:complete